MSKNPGFADDIHNLCTLMSTYPQILLISAFLCGKNIKYSTILPQYEVLEANHDKQLSFYGPSSVTYITIAQC